MAKIPVYDAVRIIPRDSGFLNRNSGNRGEIFYDQTANTLRIYNGSTVGGVSLAKNDLSKKWHEHPTLLLPGSKKVARNTKFIDHRRDPK